MIARSRLAATSALAAFCTLSAPVASAAAPVLRSADIDITIASPTSCEVTMTLAIEGASAVEHRVESFEGAHIELIATAGAQPIGEPRMVGRTRALVLKPAQTTYTLRYRVRQPDARADRCPMWLPTVPTDGQTRAVRMRVDLPAAAVPGSATPPFTWAGTRGTTSLGHVPAFVRVSYGSSADARSWDVARVMDAAAIAVFVGASGVWLWRRKRI